MSISKIFRRYVLRRVPNWMLREEFCRRQEVSIRISAGDLGFINGGDFESMSVSGIQSESGIVVGEVAHLLKQKSKPTHSLLLVGDRNSAKSVYSQVSGVPELSISTAGLHDDMDYPWNFEEKNPEEMEPVDLIVSQAMLEHLVDPYKHINDLIGLLKPGGFLIVHTVMPGFHYHRYPIDCFRFYPDWFEEVANRNNVEIVDRLIGINSYIVYCFKK